MKLFVTITTAGYGDFYPVSSWFIKSNNEKNEVSNDEIIQQLVALKEELKQ